MASPFRVSPDALRQDPFDSGCLTPVNGGGIQRPMIARRALCSLYYARSS
jgi:hypothetical protein